jgi:hypothetical protein
MDCSSSRACLSEVAVVFTNTLQPGSICNYRQHMRPFQEYGIKSVYLGRIHLQRSLANILSQNSNPLHELTQ